MEIHFQQNTQLNDGDIEITLSAKERSLEIDELIAYLKNYQSMPPAVVPIKSDDHVYLVQPENIILIDVSGNDLNVYTKEKVIPTKGRLYALIDRLNNPDFVQVSKHAAVNINHLQSLEASFTGGMTAILTDKLKTDISRKYLNVLEHRLGL
ncbi:LytTr DNA-binding domain protein [Lentilactobacillus otakiensis DSM 19908 = JCM 15040]|uniref:LytTr DNA-binding domain protein n=1 Tax=Lentilactobacillus otakiensis DSM 19908 = JCM 15040 TaxID=1423780 RepID=S4PQ15_9LACO|nr:LytTR family DNA-binding domain-containing protein [Lentilactobacillus otakiensis]KRL11573.1 LytTr DNA-binding domain protein [Lentilactobacillus otakiensis DSM 19908 = JCM 15040]GAD16825.1 lytTr DNA-binding domain protein [Lentilactobacillus otakiensis DSM 19908 = JCM 15040]